MQNSTSSFKSSNLFKMTIVLGFCILILMPYLLPGDQSDLETGIEFAIPNEEITALQSLSQTFQSWVRYPAETRAWTPMINNTAYFRDVNVGGQTYIDNAIDGDTWYATGTTPDGRNLTWSTVRFYSNYNGQQNCFVSPSWTLCNTKSVYITWYFPASQCTSGLWTMDFYYKTTHFAGGQFVTLSQIPPDAIPTVYSQLDYQDHFLAKCRYSYKWWGIEIFAQDKTCHHPTCIFLDTPVGLAEVCGEIVKNYTIAEMGCKLTSFAMMLDYHGMNVTPSELNNWLEANNGFEAGGNTKDGSILEYAQQSGVSMDFLSREDTNDVEKLKTSICQFGPQIISPGDVAHFVLAYGYDDHSGTVLILDPWGGLDTTLRDGDLEGDSYNDTFKSIDTFSGPEYTYTDLSGIQIFFNSPGEVLVTDSLGRRTGLDPINGISYQEIPNSSYNKFRIDDPLSDIPGHETKRLTLRRPADGEFTVEVVGTDKGYYSLGIDAYDAQLTPSSAKFFDLPITEGEKHSYLFNYAKTGGSPIDFYGAFDGKGQRPRDVNKLISFSNPVRASTDLPAGTTSFSLMIFYGSAVISESFSAVLNGLEITSQFDPVPGKSQMIPLNLESGRNVLKLSIQGILNDRISRDTDRLVFIVK